MRHLVLIAIATALVFAAIYTPVDPLPTVAYVDPNRLVGLWYDFAAIPTETSSPCGWAMTHEYYRDPKTHDLKYRISCYSIDGKKSIRDGEMTSKNQANFAHFQTSNTKLFGHPIFVGSKKYDVIGLDSGYRWMVVGHASLKTGWIFSKTRELPKRDLMKIREVLERTGYDSCDFFTFPQRSMDLKQPLCQLLGKAHMY